ncbi:MAG: hypothetical protein LBS46_03080 [Dysgonamonadaceae bacterium]|jgi:hypothetical protein|nr:hypothetical protein [Dysgonamonadaceae bacterium]
MQTLDKREKRQRIILNVASRKYNFLMELLGNFSFVQVEENDGDSCKDIIANLQATAKEFKLLKAGKLETRPAEDLLNEL